MSSLGRIGFGMALALVSLALATPATAGLIGSDVSWQYYAYGGPYNIAGGETNGSFIANGTVQGQFNAGPNHVYFNIIVANSTVTFDYSVASFPSTWSASSLSLAPTIYNGIALNFSGVNLTSLSIDPLTNMAGFNTSDISFTSGQLQVNWANLPFDNSTLVVLDVNNAGSTPEPVSFVLLATGLTAFGTLRRCKSR